MFAPDSPSSLAQIFFLSHWGQKVQNTHPQLAIPEPRPGGKNLCILRRVRLYFEARYLQAQLCRPFLKSLQIRQPPWAYQCSKKRTLEPRQNQQNFQADEYQPLNPANNLFSPKGPPFWHAGAPLSTAPD